MYHSSTTSKEKRQNKGAAEESYNKSAISLSARTGHMQDAALINERYAEFLNEELSDEQESKYWLGEAIRFARHGELLGKRRS
eukprot:scaffold1136_cov146-Cylindrotheca_fusiformis.AAC.15